MSNKEKLFETHIPSLPGVYLFKEAHGTVMYVGKAKNLKKRIANYEKVVDSKTTALVQASEKIDYILTKSEIEALLLEAKLIRNYQPQFNILLKSGQPYLYLLFTKETNNRLPELKIVRNKTSTGQYFGPFLEKTHVRRAHSFLINTFRIKICNKKIENGCLYYHIGKCAGSCKSDFDKESYLKRLELAKQSLTKGHKKFLQDLDKSTRESFENVFSSIKVNFLAQEKSFSHKHIWIFCGSLLLFDEQNSVTKKKEHFVVPQKKFLKYFESFYHNHDCPQLILTNFEIDNRKIYEDFLRTWHKKSYPISIETNPQNYYLKSLVKLAQIHAEQEIEKVGRLSSSIKKLLKLSTEPRTIDCFDISHQQGMKTVGSCIRFKDGKPDKNNFRKFRIKTVEKQNDYACLREIVSRRYKSGNNLPDLILIDGGRGQLNAVKNLFPEVEFAALAKREETIFSEKIPDGKKLNLKNFASQSLIALRDYAHHFAISYHKKLKENIIF